MHLDAVLIAAAAVVGTLIGLTGVGGGALMTPLLVLAFGVSPTSAITADLVATVILRPWGVALHWRRHGIEWRLVTWLSVGSVPAALAGTYLLHRLGASPSTRHDLREVLGGALLLGALAMAARLVRPRPGAGARHVAVRRTATVAVGVGAGLLVGLTSVGAGSLVAVALVVLYPHLRAERLVATDLAQSLPLTVAAGLGAVAFGHVDASLTAALVLGGVPGVAIGAWASARVPGGLVRGAVALLVGVAGVIYLGPPGSVLALGTVGVTLGVTLGARARTARRVRRSVPEAVESVIAALPARLHRDA
ncbi:MAG: sulfite exporter TauE/SafE family protein [Acidimicrobiales bacterium]